MLNKRISFSMLLAFLFILFSSSFVYASGGYVASGIVGHGNFVVANVNDSPNKIGLKSPSGIIIDSTQHRLFVADKDNNRVLVFNLDSNNNLIDRTADYVLGQLDFVSNGNNRTQNGMNKPSGLAYDPSENYLFVADSGNDRVLVFDISTITNGENAVYVIGQTNFTEWADGPTQNLMGSTDSGSQMSLFYDNNKRLFVTNDENNRVLVFDLSAGITNGMNASYVLGQSDFTSNTATTTQNGMNKPSGISYSSTTKYLFVSDYYNNRVLVFDLSHGITNGMNASYVLGQSDFISNGYATAQNNFWYPMGLSYDENNSRLFVSDGATSNRRVLIFDVSTITNGMNASYVLGQVDFRSNVSTTTQSGVAGTNCVEYDSQNNYLYVSDAYNNRVLIFDVSIVTNGEVAIDLIGQLNPDSSVNYVSSGANDTPNDFGFDNPSYDVIDTVNHRLFVADSNNNRVLVFNLDSNNNLIDRTADYVLGQPDFKTNSSGLSQNKINSISGLAYDKNRNLLFVSDYNNSRVLVFDVSTITNGENAINVIGANNFSESGYGITSHNFANPDGLYYDSINKRLFVSDIGANRILIFDVSTITNGMDASYVLGQPDFTSYNDPRYKDSDTYYYTTKNGLSKPTGLALDSQNNHLFVADSNDNRVLVFNVSVSTITNGEDPMYVLGRPDFTSTGSYRPNFGSFDIPPSPDVNRLASPMEVYYLYKYGVKLLFVADYLNSRVMVYDVTSITNGENAIGVLGQTDFISNDCSTSQYGMCNPKGISYDTSSNRMFVVDSGNHRILVYDLIKIVTNSLPSATLNKSYYNSINVVNNQGTVSYELKNGSLPPGMTLGSVEGTPTEPGIYTFTVEAKDNMNGIGYFADIRTYTINVSNPPGASLPPIAYAPPTPPSPSPTNLKGKFKIEINDGAETTRSRTVKLKLSGGPDAINMAISNSEDFKGAVQEPYKTTKEWTLTSGNGEKVVYVKFYTKWGQSSETISDSIMLINQTTQQTGQTAEKENEAKQISAQTKQISQETLDSIKKQIQTIMEKILEIRNEILKILEQA